MILAEKILLLWVGSEYVQYGFLMQVILVIPLLSLFISHGGSILLGMNVKMKLFAYLAWLIFIANTLFTLLTIEEWELTSVVVGRIIGLLIAIPIANIAFIKVFKINSKEYSFSLAMLVLLLVVPYYVNFVLLDMWNQNSISNLLFSGIVLYIISTVRICRKNHNVNHGSILLVCIFRI
jgi:O-antigen/teichoic acid export membrane protein